MLLGCIGDDFTGSSDLGNTLTKAGMRVTQYVGVPDTSAAPGVEAGIVALKSRSIPVDQAVKLSLAALEWLRAQGCTQFLFKYCSTFDSTPQGNIGPVAEALADALGDHPHVGDVRGEGLLCAVEFVKDKDDRIFFDPSEKIGPQISAALLAQSQVIARAMPQGDILGFAPPFCLTRAEADIVVAATVQAVGAVLGEGGLDA